MTGPLDPLTTTMTWMLEHLDEPLTVESLARRAHTSPRSFMRHFAATTGSTPHQWLQRHRIHLAQRLLETSDASVEVVARKCGLGTATNLRTLFRRHVGTSPSLYRDTFSRNGDRPGTPA
ncbi:helix-turn-helix domain-containing protein [Rhodococcus sp. NBC_00294]|uniref:helix-turn-helix domain-containing protein n=1 Tax=Rhodococcus sp. NBC_00294 TaxID=2976004 RepID=UPI002E2979ED|nr:helix-turn-helix domain-containing protein [Rhodococcus sp. NBC_00294]